MITLNQFKRIAAPMAATAVVAVLAGCRSSKDSKTAVYYSDPSYMTSSQKYSTSSSYAGGTADQSSAQTSMSTEVPLFKEEVKVGKRTVDAGTVQLRKTVKTETVNEPIELRHETITIDRQEAGGAMAQGQSQTPSGQSQAQSGENLSQPFQEGQMEIRLHREEAVVEKQIVPAGTVVVRKNAEVQQTNIQSEVRQDDVAITRSGSAQSETTPMGGTGESGGRTQGSATSGSVITDLSSLSSGNVSEFEGQSVRLTGVQVQQAFGDRLIALQAQGKPIYVRLAQPQQLKAGDTVDLSGTIKRSTETTIPSGLGAQEQQALQGQAFYIEAQTIRPKNQ
jgi:stress response protein YsnF